MDKNITTIVVTKCKHRQKRYNGVATDIKKLG